MSNNYRSHSWECVKKIGGREGGREGGRGGGKGGRNKEEEEEDRGREGTGGEGGVEGVGWRLWRGGRKKYMHSLCSVVYVVLYSEQSTMSGFLYVPM